MLEIGSQTYAKAMGLSSLGHEIYVISRSIDSQRHEKTDGGIVIIRVPGMEDVLPEMTDTVAWITNSVVVAAEIEALNDRVGIDLIDFPEWGAEGYVYLLNRLPWKRIPAVIHLHGPLVMLAHTIGWPEKESSFYKVGCNMEATCVQLAEAVYSSSECSAQWINKYYEPKKKEIPIIHLGINTDLFKPLTEAKNERPTIVFAGKLVKNKGIEELVEAAAALAREIPDLQLNIIGTGQENYIKSLIEKANNLGAPSLLNLLGYISSEMLPLEFSKGHVFCAPSYYEGGPGFVYLEAMACGLPVIGCSGSGVEEIVTPGINGFLVPPRDTDSLTKELRKLLTDKKLADEMGKNGREYILREAESTSCLKKLEAFYYSVLESKPVNA